MTACGFIIYFAKCSTNWYAESLKIHFLYLSWWCYLAKEPVWSILVELLNHIQLLSLVSTDKANKIIRRSFKKNAGTFPNLAILCSEHKLINLLKSYVAMLMPLVLESMIPNLRQFCMYWGCTWFAFTVSRLFCWLSFLASSSLIIWFSFLLCPGRLRTWRNPFLLLVRFMFK